MLPKRLRNGEFVFDGYPTFRPNLSPKEIFEMGSFGGTYWRPIYSHVTRKHYKNMHRKYRWSKKMSNKKLTRKDYDKRINKYGVEVGTSLRFWEQKKWIKSENPYGWVHWYCDFFEGKRGPDDVRQIGRWGRTAGPRSRFRLALINMIRRKGARLDDYTVSPKIRQTLQHWAVRLQPYMIKK